MKIYLKILSLFLILILSLTGVSALGVSAESTYTQPEKFIDGDVDIDGTLTVDRKSVV